MIKPTHYLSFYLVVKKLTTLVRHCQFFCVSSFRSRILLKGNAKIVSKALVPPAVYKVLRVFMSRRYVRVIGPKRGVMWFIPLGQRTRGINHITTSWRPINGLFLHKRGSSRDAKIHWRKMPLLFIFLLFFNTPCWHWWHSQVSQLFNYVSFSKSHFKLVVRSEC